MEESLGLGHYLNGKMMGSHQLIETFQAIAADWISRGSQEPGKMVMRLAAGGSDSIQGIHTSPCLSRMCFGQMNEDIDLHIKQVWVSSPFPCEKSLESKLIKVQCNFLCLKRPLTVSEKIKYADSASATAALDENLKISCMVTHAQITQNESVRFGVCA